MEEEILVEEAIELDQDNMKVATKILSTLILIIVSTISSAQYINLGSKFTQTQLFGSSRNIAMGGIGTAIGGDVSNIGLNPAGLAFYRGNDFSINLNVVDIQSQTTYLGNLSASGSTKFNMPNFGIVLAEPIKDYAGKENNRSWSSYAFGIGYSRVNLFSNNLNFFGYNTNSSLSQRFAENASKNGLGNNSLSEQAYNAYIINQDTNNFEKFNPVSTGNVNQEISDKLSGAQSQMSFSGAIAYQNKLYLGAALNILNVNSNSSYTFSESGIVDTTNNLSSFNYFENSQISGAGINMKLGFIFRPVDYLRIGASYQTQSYLALTENYDLSVASQFGMGDSSFTFDPLYYNYSFSYKLAPKYNVGFALFFKKIGFISGEIEFVNYTSNKFQSSSDAQLNSDVNQQIASTYTSTQNYKLGGELRLDMFYLRTGFANNGNPFSDAKNINARRNDFTYGLGFRNLDFYIDGSYVYSYTNGDYVPYTTSGDSPIAFMHHVRNSFMITVGSKF